MYNFFWSLQIHRTEHSIPTEKMRQKLGHKSSASVSSPYEQLCCDDIHLWHVWCADMLESVWSSSSHYQSSSIVPLLLMARPHPRSRVGIQPGVSHSHEYWSVSNAYVEGLEAFNCTWPLILNGQKLMHSCEVTPYYNCILLNYIVIVHYNLAYNYIPRRDTHMQTVWNITWFFIHSLKGVDRY